MVVAEADTISATGHIRNLMGENPIHCRRMIRKRNFVVLRIDGPTHSFLALIREFDELLSYPSITSISIYCV